MQNKPIPFTVAYKVVQVLPNGEMWSVNKFLRAMGTKDFKRHPNTLQYKLRHRVVPFEGSLPLFVCPTLEEAQKAIKFYSSPVRYILRGYAENLRLVTHLSNDEVIEEVCNMVPSDFKSALCDSFIPIGIVGKLTRPYA